MLTVFLLKLNYLQRFVNTLTLFFQINKKYFFYKSWKTRENMTKNFAKKNPVLKPGFRLIELKKLLF